MAVYNIFVADSKDSYFWFQPSAIKPEWRNSEPSLDHAIKAQRFYERMYGIATKRELAE